MTGVAAEAFLFGFGSGFSLIFAIGAQNAFVLRCGLSGRHVLPVCLICAVSDAFLIAAGVSGFYWLIRDLPWLETAARAGGALFLSGYALRNFYRVFSVSESLHPSETGPGGLFSASATCLALTFLNPHVYLDTVFLLGSFSSKYPLHSLQFGLGAVCASFVFFFSLGYGAAALRPFFASPKSWKALDAGIGVLMLFLAIGLLADFFT